MKLITKFELVLISSEMTIRKFCFLYAIDEASLLNEMLNSRIEFYRNEVEDFIEALAIKPTI